MKAKRVGTAVSDDNMGNGSNRNKPCSCGSGKKRKNCCDAPAPEVTAQAVQAPRNSLTVRHFADDITWELGAPGVFLARPVIWHGDYPKERNALERLVSQMVIDLPCLLPLQDGFSATIPSAFGAYRLVHWRKRAGQEEFSTLPSHRLPEFSSLIIEGDARPALPVVSGPVNPEGPLPLSEAQALADEIISRMNGLIRGRRDSAVPILDPESLSYRMDYLDRQDPGKLVCRVYFPFSGTIAIPAIEDAEPGVADAELARDLLSAPLFTAPGATPQGKPDETSTSQVPILKLCSGLEGRVSKMDLIGPLCAFGTTLSYVDTTPGYIFDLSCPGYSLVLQVYADGIELRRNGESVKVPLAAGERAGEFWFLGEWTPTHLRLSVRDREGIREDVKSTRTTLPPARLLDWARRDALAFRTSYRTADDLFQAAVLHLQLLVQKIIDTGATHGFWNVTYDGRRIQCRKPKRETDIHPQIALLLKDLELQSGLHVIPEYPAGNGRLDFLISGQTESGQLIKVCVEFKLAHATDFAHGFQVQLPEYMARLNTDYGIYGVLDFGNEHRAPASQFDIPNVDTSEFDLQFALMFAAYASAHSRLRWVWFDLSRRASPSKA